MTKKVKSSVMIPEDLWKDIRVRAIRRGMAIGELVEYSFRKTMEESEDLK